MRCDKKLLKTNEKQLSTIFFQINSCLMKSFPESSFERKQWQSHLLVVPSLQIQANPLSQFLSGEQKETFSITWSTIIPLPFFSTTLQYTRLIDIIIIHKITPSVRFNQWLKRLHNQLCEPTNQNSIKISNVINIQPTNMKLDTTMKLWGLV